MPLKIPPEDRKLAIVFGLMLVVALLLVAYAIGSDGGSGGTPSSYSAGNSGTKAGYLLLEQTGYAVRRWTEPPARLASYGAGTTLILADPIATDEYDIGAVQQFVRRGGRLVITGPSGALFFPSKRARPGMPHFEWKSYKASEPSELTRGIDEIELAPQIEFDESSGETPFRDGLERPVTHFSYGTGEVIWWSTPEPMTNSAIREKDNVQLLLNSVGDPGRGPVLWDEYFHEGGKTVIDSVMASPLRWGLLQSALIGFLVCATFSRRFGPARQSLALSRLAPMEFVETLAALYQKSGAAHIAVEIVYERFRDSLQRTLSIRKDASADQVATSLAGLLPGSNRESLRKMILDVEEAVSDPRTSVKRVIALVSTMHEVRSKLKLRSEGD